MTPRFCSQLSVQEKDSLSIFFFSKLQSFESEKHKLLQLRKIQERFINCILLT